MEQADIALPVPVPRAFSYVVPDALAGRVHRGSRVVCPFRSKRLVGVVLDVKASATPSDKLKPIAAMAEGGDLPEDLVEFLITVSQYYLAPIGEVVQLALPPMDRAAAELVAEPTLFDRARGVASKRAMWAVPTALVEDTAKLGGQAAGILARVRADGALPISVLEKQWPSARQAVKKLSTLGLVTLESRAAPEAPLFPESVPRDTPPTLTRDQTSAVAAIDAAMHAQGSATFLLHGVTGSGKTEVYLHAVAVAKDLGRGAIVLVPEIALTPQLVARFRARFGDDVAVIHSGLTPRERLVMWQKLRSGAVHLAVGARSALFAPVQSLGLIVVDEEHDPSFKQEEGVLYHARDMAILRAHRASGVCVLGSATPSLETEHLVRSGKATRLDLPERARAQALPRVEIVDLRRFGAGPTGDRRITLPLLRALQQTVEDKKQSIVFLNRRGFAPSVACTACGEMASCPHCAVALTFHKGSGGSLRCHYCEYWIRMPEVCPKCQSPDLELEGLGTERVEEALREALPAARLARLDRDVATPKKVEALMQRMRTGDIDVLVGTQMVTKGHDLPEVTLVGVLNADAALSIPDFRAAERAFQLLVQVAGRAGRGETAGRVLIQTYDPSRPAVVFAQRHDVKGFIEQELRDRRELGYPPYSRLALVRVDAVDERQARQAAADIAHAARRLIREQKIDVLGPAPAPLSRLRNRFRFRVMLRSKERAALRSVLLPLRDFLAELPRAVRAEIDVDPVQLL